MTEWTHASRCGLAMTWGAQGWWANCVNARVRVACTFRAGFVASRSRMCGESACPCDSCHKSEIPRHKPGERPDSWCRISKFGEHGRSGGRNDTFSYREDLVDKLSSGESKRQTVIARSESTWRSCRWDNSASLRRLPRPAISQKRLRRIKEKSNDSRIRSQ